VPAWPRAQQAGCSPARLGEVLQLLPLLPTLSAQDDMP
jgi:hypothetical protein